jgi:cytochrome P450
MTIASITSRGAGREPVRLPGNPVLGHLREFKRDRLALFERTFRECGDMGVYRLGRTPFYFANSVELAQDVLISQARPFEKTNRFRTFLRPLLGEGLLTAPNGLNKTQRRLIQPSFTANAIKRSAGFASAYAERMAGMWRDGDVVDVRREMVRLLLWIVGKNLFSRDVFDEADELGAALTNAINGLDRMARAAVPLTIEWPTPVNLRYRGAIARFERSFYGFLNERRTSGERPPDWLTMLLDSRYDDGSPMSDRQIRDEALTMYMAAHETTATGLTWTFYLLAQNPEAYARLQEETRRVLGGRTPELADRPNLPYALQVFKEALRLYPPVYYFGRQAVEDVTVAGYNVPAGTPVLFSPYVLHRRPDYFPEPDRFIPERFAPAEEAKIPRHAWMPFGTGPRTCIGNNHALLNGHLIVATLAQRVHFTALEPLHVGTDPQMTLRPRGVIRMQVSTENAVPI